MKLFWRCLVVCGSSLAIVSGGQVGHQQASYLRVPQSPAAATPKVELNARTKTEDDHPGYNVWQGVVVPKEEADAVVGNLSKDCGKQSKDILNGPKESISVLIPEVKCEPNDKEGSPLICKMSPVEEECKDLKGEMCSVQAKVEYEKKVKHPLVDLKGKNCVPETCTKKQDLTTIYTFARKKALEHVPDDGAQMQIVVDCTAVGGHLIIVGGLRSGAASFSSALVSVFLALVLFLVDW